MDEQTRAFIAGVSVGRRLRGALRGGEAWSGGGGGSDELIHGILVLPGFVIADPSGLTVSGILALPGAVVEDEE